MIHKKVGLQVVLKTHRKLLLIFLKNNIKLFKYTASHDINVNSVQLFNGGGCNCSQYLT